MAFTLTTRKWLHVVSAGALALSFFLPWVCWKNIPISGYHMPSGKFFDVAGTSFGLGNPFPQLNFSFYVFWLIPILALLVIVLVLRNKKTVWPVFITVALSLGLLSIFFLFTYEDLVIETNVLKVLQPAGYLAAGSATGLILTILPPQPAYKIIIVWLVGPLFAFLSHMFVVKYYNNATFSETGSVKADYSMNASELLREFISNDSTANNKYREKIISINGPASEVEVQSDSTVNIKFIDSTGSYIIFPIEKDQYDKASKIKPGDPVSLKGSCSGSVYSEILGITSISFKRTTINNNK